MVSIMTYNNESHSFQVQELQGHHSRNPLTAHFIAHWSNRGRSGREMFCNDG